MHSTATIATKQTNTGFEVGSLDGSAGLQQAEKKHSASYIRYLVAGVLFGIILVKSEVISWFRIQEMFRLQSFHMYGVIGSAVLTGMLSVQLIKRFHIRSVNGKKIVIPQKKFNKGQIFGGLLFGFGWALTGACPGPIYAQIGSGVPVMIVALFSAIAGTWVYGLLREKLPH